MKEPESAFKQIYKEKINELYHIDELMKEMNGGHYAYDVLWKMRQSIGNYLFDMIREQPELLREEA